MGRRKKVKSMERHLVTDRQYIAEIRSSLSGYLDRDSIGILLGYANDINMEKKKLLCKLVRDIPAACRFTTSSCPMERIKNVCRMINKGEHVSEDGVSIPLSMFDSPIYSYAFVCIPYGARKIDTEDGYRIGRIPNVCPHHKFQCRVRTCNWRAIDCVNTLMARGLDMAGILDVYMYQMRSTNNTKQGDAWHHINYDNKQAIIDRFKKDRKWQCAHCRNEEEDRPEYRGAWLSYVFRRG